MTPKGTPFLVDNALRSWTGWTSVIYRGPFGIGYFGRLESGVLYRGGRFAAPLKDWWWRPTFASIGYKLDREAVEHPIPVNVTTLRRSPVVTSTYEDDEWDDA